MLNEKLSEAFFATLLFIVFAGLTIGILVLAYGFIRYGDPYEPPVILGLLLGFAAAIWTGRNALTTIPMAASLLRTGLAERRQVQQAAIAAHPNRAAFKTGLFRLWIVGSVAWLPLGYYLWTDTSGRDLLSLIGWLSLPPLCMLLFALALQWAIKGFDPKAKI